MNVALSSCAKVILGSILPKPSLMKASCLSVDKAQSSDKLDKSQSSLG